jgi:hypothetical protein
MVMFLVVEPTHLGSNPRFDVSVTYLWVIIFLVVGDVHINNEVLFNRLCEFQDQTDTVVPLPLLHLKNATMQQNSTCA